MAHPDISEFSGDNRWLSNFAKVNMMLMGDERVYPTLEHAFQAAKFDSPAIRDVIHEAATPGDAKKVARLKINRTSIRKDWNNVRTLIMYTLLQQKFCQQPFKSKLLATGKCEIVEGNWWGDQYWGVCEDIGENVLGRLIMLVRTELGVMDHA